MPVACRNDVLPIGSHEGILTHGDIGHDSRLRLYRPAENIQPRLSGSGRSYIRDNLALLYRNDQVKLTEIRNAELVVFRLGHALLLEPEAYATVLAALGRNRPGNAYGGVVHLALHHVLDVKVVNAGGYPLFCKLRHNALRSYRSAAVERLMQYHVGGIPLGVESYLHRAVYRFLLFAGLPGIFLWSGSRLRAGRIHAHFAVAAAVFLQGTAHSLLKI